VQYTFAAGDGFRPASIGFEISSDEGQAIARLGPAFPQHGAHRILAVQISNRGAHVMARGQQLQNGMAANETGASGNQNCAHRF
jgi:hypothetical protein